jgi:hypothetical protein
MNQLNHFWNENMKYLFYLHRIYVNKSTIFYFFGKHSGEGGDGSITLLGFSNPIT